MPKNFHWRRWGAEWRVKRAICKNEKLLRSAVPPPTLSGTIKEQRDLLRSVVPPNKLAGTMVMEGKFTKLKCQEGTVPPSQKKMRKMPGSVESNTQGKEKARKLLLKSGIFENKVDNPEPHLHLENPKKVTKGLTISSKFINIRKIKPVLRKMKID